MFASIYHHSDISKQSYESGGGRFSILPGTTQTYLTIPRMVDQSTSSLPGQWNGSSEFSEKSPISKGINETLQQGGPLSPYNESSEENSMSSDDKPLQWRAIDSHQESIQFTSPKQRHSPLSTIAAARRQYKGQQQDQVEELQDDLRQDRNQLERKRGRSMQAHDGEDHQRVSVAIQGIEVEIDMDESREEEDDDDDEFQQHSEGDYENQDAFELDDLEEQSPSDYHESLQLDLLTLDLNNDLGLHSLLTDDELSEFGHFETPHEFKKQERSARNYTPPPVIRQGLEKKERFPKRTRVVPIDVPTDLTKERKTESKTVSKPLDRNLESPEELKRRHPGLFDGKGIFFSGPVRNSEPVKIVEPPPKLRVGFALPEHTSSSAAVEIYENQWDDLQERNTANRYIGFDKPLLQLKLADEHFTCEMPIFKPPSPRKPVETKVDLPRPKATINIPFSSKMPPTESLPEKPEVQPAFSVTIIKPAPTLTSRLNEAKQEVLQSKPPTPLFSQPRAAPPIPIKSQVNQPTIVPTPEAIPTIAPVAKAIENSTFIPSKKEEVEKTSRLPHPLSQSYSAADEEERTLDHPRSSYIAHQLDRFNSTPSQAHDKSPPSQPYCQSAGAHSPKSFETLKVARMVQPSIADRFSPENSSTSGARYKDLSLVRLKEQDIDYIEEGSILVEQSALFGIRRKLVGDFADLGYKYNKVSRRKEDRQVASMGVQSEKSSGSYTLKRMTLGPEKELREREELLEAREQDLTIEALSKAEMAYVKFEIWTEARHGRWMIKGPAIENGVVADELPQIADVWALPIDSKGVVRRNKCKSNVELTSTKTVVRCPDCLQDTSSMLYRRCASCNNSKLVEMVYNVQCTIRLANFTPLTLPARLLLGNKQPHIKYIEATDFHQIKEILHDRAVDALQSAASRVYATHHAKHGSRLLMGRATVTRRGVLTVKVTSFKTKVQRAFDVQDGPDGLVTEVTEFICPKIVKRGASPSPSSPFKEGGLSFRQGNGSNTSLNSSDRGEGSIISDRGRSVKSPFKGSIKEERVSSPLSSSAVQTSVIAPLPKRGWKTIFAR